MSFILLVLHHKSQTYWFQSTTEEHQRLQDSSSEDSKIRNVAQTNSFTQKQYKGVKQPKQAPCGTLTPFSPVTTRQRNNIAARKLLAAVNCGRRTEASPYTYV